MSIFTEEAKSAPLQIGSYVANESLASSQYVAVSPVEASAGRMKVGLPGGQGVFTVGILQNAPASGELAVICEEGYSPAIASGAFNAGIELTVAGATGKLEAAASGDYVIAIAREASAGANHRVSVRVISPYIKS